MALVWETGTIQVSRPGQNECRECERDIFTVPLLLFY